MSLSQPFPIASGATAERGLGARIEASTWQLIGAAALANRLVLGWVYWGGASRRFLYATQKIDPTSPGYLANKLVHAAPGVPFGLDGMLHWVLSQPLLLQIAVIGFSLVELVVGVGLIIGLGTRLMSLIGLGLAAFLMIVFGWMGTTCLDEWTMAASGFAMASVTLLAGSGPLSVDNMLVRSGQASRRPWLAWLTSGALPVDRTRYLGIAATLGVISIAFTVLFYGYNFGAIYSPLGKRVDNLHPHVTLSDAAVGDGRVSVNAYMDAGPDTQGLYVVRAVLAPADTATAATPVFAYDATDLTQGDTVKIANRYAPWSTCKKIAYGLRCQLGTKSNLSFALPAGSLGATGNAALTLTLTDVEGKTFSVPVRDAR